MSEHPMGAKADVKTAMLRGLTHKCPNCGKGKLFRAYLKPVAECSACGERLDRFPADDGPAYLTILVVGHLVVGPLLAFDFIFTQPPEVVIPATLIPLTVLSLLLLPFFKGAFIGLLWHHSMKNSEPTE